MLSVMGPTHANLQYLGIMQMEMALNTSQGREIVLQQPEVVALQLPELLPSLLVLQIMVSIKQTKQVE